MGFINVQEDNYLSLAMEMTYLHGWVVPRDIVEPEIICENEDDVGLSVVLGPPLLQGEATVAEECHQEGDQHSSSQLILLKCCLKLYVAKFRKRTDKLSHT